MSTEESAQLTWFKSSYSGNEGGACLEMAPTAHTVHVRDSKEPSRTHLVFTRGTWTAFVGFTRRP